MKIDIFKNFWLFLVLMCTISFVCGGLFIGETMSVKYQASVDRIDNNYHQKLSRITLACFNKETKLRTSLNIQGELCTDYMVEMYNDMCDENPKKSTYDHLKDLK